MQENIKFDPKICETCHQTTKYLLCLDRGTAEIVIAIAKAIGKKGINAIHPRREMEAKFTEPTRNAYLMGALDSNQIGNLSRPHRHGLIAKIKGESGNWCLTSKGAAFLRGESVPKYAIVSKITGHQEGYLEGDSIRITIRECIAQDTHWEGIDFRIENGRIIKDLPIKAPPQASLAI